MEAYYILIVAVLFILAISDLIVGVSNDAVNFLNSAIGSKAAKFQTILIIAAVGVLLGAVFSHGMMEVARKGIFHPGQFSFEEIMVLFLAVMMTDILLLDFFNTIGLPTSTTVSIVFELLGASVAIAVFKIAKSDGAYTSMSTFINTDSAMLIIAGIFLSVIIAFTVGLIIMGIVRFAFSFNYIKTNKYWGGVWGGFAITTILYFLLIKGAKGSTLVTPEILEYLKENTIKILLISFAGWTVIFQLLIMFTRINIMKITVLIGTFALAMAFAGNDLVNFIGVPIAGFKSFQAFSGSGADPSGLMMTALEAEKVKTPLYFLIAAGMIMVITLRLSKKAKSVTATTIDLSRQGAGSERFESIGLARFVVRKTVALSNFTKRITPAKFENFRASRFDDAEVVNNKKDKVAFDLVRASVNLVVASILISIGTSLKLPLSTTYVTFMVAMGTSLADGAWGRESAVYRITGVLTVIGGWFFTAFSAFTAAFILATVIFFGKLPVIFALIAFAIFTLLRTHAFHKRKTAEKEQKESQRENETYQQILVDCDNEVKSSVIQVSKLLFLTYNAFAKEKLKDIKDIKKQSKKLNKQIRHIKDSLPETLKKFLESDIDSGHFYVQVIDHLKETSSSLGHIVQPAFNHLDNNHPLDQEQSKELKAFNDVTNEFFNFAISMFQSRSFDKLLELNEKKEVVIDQINEIIKHRIKILKKTQKGSKVSITYIDMLTETKNLVSHVVQLIKATGQMEEKST